LSRQFVLCTSPCEQRNPFVRRRNYSLPSSLPLQKAWRTG
jgi:hypothetical protein